MNVQAGDLAYLSSECVAEGLVVEVVRFAGNSLAGFPAWFCRSRELVECIREASGAVALVSEFAVEDQYLRPIAGPRFASDTPTAIETPIATNIGAQGWM